MSTFLRTQWSRVQNSSGIQGQQLTLSPFSEHGVEKHPRCLGENARRRNYNVTSMRANYRAPQVIKSRGEHHLRRFFKGIDFLPSIH
ncbi:hypothetical protein NPIL_638221 [Nephila pilipes]|uniref:Uncharacterized protein n=1 Tax=Nephila pilipes TaxID=299642 RepID=A0A8X6QPN1_NEPPI|nr:hypothetical protein NPIL_638221 [Nephila pilipes]